MTERNREAVRRYRERNPEKVRASNREANRRYQAAHPEQVRERKRRWAESNPPDRETARANERAYRERNAERIRANEKRRRERNPEKMREKARRWEQRNREAVRLRNQRRRAMVRQVTVGVVTVELVEQKMAYWGCRCWVCGGPFQAVDHVKPIAAGGGHMLCNLRPICTPCNSRKQHRWFGPSELGRVA